MSALIKKLVTVLIVSLALVSCSRFRTSARTYPFYLEGPAGLEVGVYKIRQDKAQGDVSYIPFAKLPTEKEVLLEAGSYFIANECSGLAYNHLGPSRMSMTKVTLNLPQVNSPLPTNSDVKQVDNIQAECTDPIDGIRSEWKNRTEFYFLPGTSRFFAGGRVIELSGAKQKYYQFDLFPLTVVAAESATSQERFFVFPEDTADSKNSLVVSAEVGETVWLLPGTYGLEINGSRRKITVDRGNEIEVPLGVLRIDTPKGFSLINATDDRQPIFAYINEAVLFNLNADYSVFPGNYIVSIGGSDLKDVFLVESGKKTVVSTLAAQIDLPPCKANSRLCKNPPGITLHRDHAPYALMTVDTGTPFLVLNSKYEFGVEGTRGVLKELRTSADAVHKETLARLRIHWEVRRSEKKQRTELVRIESRGAPHFGRTLDLLFHKPDEIYLPGGSYQLTYLLYSQGSEPVKHRIDLSVREGELREVTVPIFPDKVESSQESASKTAPEKEDENRLPARLMPIHR